MSNKIDKILAEISAGELFDKITILEIKKAKISNKEKLININKELSSLNETVKKFIPEAKINFLEKETFTPLIDDQDDSRIRKEIDFHPRTFEEGVECLIKEARGE